MSGLLPPQDLRSKQQQSKVGAAQEPSDAILVLLDVKGKQRVHVAKRSKWLKDRCLFCCYELQENIVYI